MAVLVAQDEPEVEAEALVVWVAAWLLVAALLFDEELEAVDVVELLAEELAPEEPVDELFDDADPAELEPPMVSWSPG